MPRRIVIIPANSSSADVAKTRAQVRRLRHDIEKGWIEPAAAIKAGILLKALDRYEMACRKAIKAENDDFLRQFMETEHHGTP